MDETVIQKNAKILTTPLGDFTVEDGHGYRIEFDILPAPTVRHTVRSVYVDYGREEKVYNYKDFLFRIDTSRLKLKEDYLVKFTERLEYRDADERLFTYGITKEDKILAISFPDPNEEENEKDMRFFNFEPKDGQMILRLLDCNKKFIFLSVAYAWGIEDYEMENYEEAVDSWAANGIIRCGETYF